SRLAFKPSARLHTVQIPVNVQLQENRRMIRRPARRFRLDSAKPKRSQIKLLDKDIDHSNGVVLADPVFRALRKQRALPAIDPFNETLHPIPPQIARES